MNDIQILGRNQAKVLERLKLGEIDSMELAVDQVTDDFMLYGFLCFGYRVARETYCALAIASHGKRSGLIDELASSFPDPRKECEITIKQILSASRAS